MKYKIIALLFLVQLYPGLKGYSQQFEPTEVLILGTVHLSTLQGVTASHLSRLIDSLYDYKFDAIAVEQMPPDLLLDIQSRKAAPWQELLSHYSNSLNIGNTYQEIFEIDYDSARHETDSLLMQNELSVSDRVRLMKSALASYDIWSAVLNYQYLENEVGPDTAVVNLLEDLGASSNEINLIGVNLARQLNLNRIHYIDNLQDETMLAIQYPSFFEDYRMSQTEIGELLSAVTIFDEVNTLTEQSIEAMDLFPLYKFLNSERYMREDYEGQWKLWLKTGFKSKTDRSRYSLWEMRNLQIAANITRLVAKYPEKRILVIIGASHKSFIEKHLSQIPDIKLMKL